LNTLISNFNVFYVTIYTVDGTTQSDNIIKSTSTSTTVNYSTQISNTSINRAVLDGVEVASPHFIV